MSRTFKDTEHHVAVPERSRMKLLRCAYCNLPPQTDLDECPSGLVSKCSTYENEVYQLAMIGMSDTEIARTLALKGGQIGEWKAQGDLAIQKRNAGRALTDAEKTYARFLQNLARKNHQLQIRLQQLLTSRAAKGDIDTKDAIAILERLAKERWAKQSTLVIDDQRQDRGMLEVIAPTVAMVIRGVIDGLGLTEAQLEMVPELLQRSFQRFEIEAEELEAEAVEVDDDDDADGAPVPA